MKQLSLIKRSRFFHLFVYGFFLLTVGLLFSCGGGDSEQKSAPKTEVVTKPVAREVSLEKMESDKKADVSAYAYNPVGKRDPFEPYALEVGPHSSDVPLTPLQKFSIDQLKLVGIVWGISNPRAMVEDPKGKGHVIKRNTLIGQNWGKVTRIKQDEVIIAEEYRDIDGRLVVNEISLKLPKPKDIEEE